MLVLDSIQLSIRTTEYDYHMEALKETRKLITQDKLMHVRWMANIITKAKEKAEWVTKHGSSALVTYIMPGHLLNIIPDHSIEIPELAIKENTTFPAPEPHLLVIHG
ncbi:hypothetical protein HAX54_051065, partial [Datura stramonium]|nr:hypothetical protein [Datura stramonium]